MNPRKTPAPPVTTGYRGDAASRGTTGKRAAAVPTPARPSAPQLLDLLADGIEKFKLEFERFFAGASVVPPDDHRAKLVRDLRELRGVQLRTSADQFRLASLEARFNSYSELFHRRLRDREEGRTARPARSAAAPERPLDAAAGVIVTDRLEAEAVDALYRGLTRRASGASAAAQASGGPAMDLATFRGYLAQQLEAIRLKTGCEAVQFRIATEDGKLKLKAKPVGR